MNKFKFCSLIVLFFIETLSGQSLFFKYKKNNFIEKSVDSLLKLSISKKDFISVANISHDYSIKLYKNKKYFKAIEYALIEINTLEKIKQFNESYTKALYNIGRFYYLNEQYDNAIKFYKKVIIVNNSSYKIGQAYGELGRCFNKKEEYFKSIDFFKKGIRILRKEKKTKKVNKSLFSHYINLAIIYKNLDKKNDLYKSFEALRKASQINNISNLGFISKINLNNGFANYYNSLQTYNYNKAKLYYKKNLKLAIDKGDSLVISTTFNNLSELHILKNRDSLLFFADKGLHFANTKDVIAMLYENKSKYFLSNGNLKLALKFIHSSIKIYTNIGNEVYSIPKKNNLIDNHHKSHLINCLLKKVEILIELYEQNKGDKHLIVSAFENIKIIDFLITFIEDSSEEYKTKLHWRKEASKAYLKAVYTAFLLNDSESAFYFMERNKALLLTESITKNTEQTHLPKNIAEKNNSFLKNIFELENKIESEKQGLLQDSLFTTKQVFRKYKDSIKLLDPKSFKNKLEIEQIRLTQVQKEIGKNEIIISYTWNNFNDENELVLAQVITKKKIFLFKIEDIFLFKSNIKSYRALVSKPFETKLQKENFKNVSYNLYKQLFPNKMIRDLLLHKDLVILPDGHLQNLSFDSLITKENTFEYLLNSSTISYAYSMSFLKYNNQVQRKTINNFIGYSPVTFENHKLEDLNNTKEEITVIKNEIGGEIFLKSEAKKKHFLTESTSSKIIHLATHADASNNPWIAFSDEKLELHELYTYKNNADLVVLSACNTTLGEVVKGEGVLSLARGFFYSGAKSVVSSLWNVNDKSTSFIMTDFYKNLKSGQTKSLALANAQRNYLKTHSLSELSPYYWSSFILIGDTGTIDFANNNNNNNNNNNKFIVIAIFLILITGLFFFFKRKIKN
jgi:CHAT domain-containing protein